MRFRFKQFQAMSDFKTNCLQRVRFQIKFFTTRQILKQNFHNVSDFISNYLQRVRFCLKTLVLKSDFQQKYAFKKSCFDLVYPENWMNFAFFVHFKKHDSDEKFLFWKAGFLTKN